MLSEKDILRWQERYQDLLREAKQGRLARQALAGNKRARLRERALAWLGEYFVTWGCYLQRRYDFGIVEGAEVSSFDPARSAHDCGCVS